MYYEWASDLHVTITQPNNEVTYQTGRILATRSKTAPIIKVFFPPDDMLIGG